MNGEELAGALSRLGAAYEALRPDTLDELLALYAPDAEFKDPFNEVCGRAEIGRIFRHMEIQVAQPRFVVHGCYPALNGLPEGMLVWRFTFTTRGMRPRMLQVHGSSLIRFNPHGAVVLHRDFWDTGEELYAKLPLLGGLFRWLQRAGRA